MSGCRLHSKSRQVIRWGLYPVSWAIVLYSFHLISTAKFDPQLVWAICVGILASSYLLIEWQFPFEKRWSMSLKSFISDFKFAIINTIFVAGMSGPLAFFAIGLSLNNSGWASELAIFTQLALCLLFFEAINYSIHRAMHEGKGRLGRILWYTHAAHHLPPRLYLVMHAVFHPLNGVIIQSLAIILPIWLMGYSQQVVTMFLIINGMHGLISHFNVDVRMGIFNYLFVGPELHRYHHSAKMNEAKNYGATLSIFDQLFGTFVYKPQVSPVELGVNPAEGLPDYDKIFEVLKLPIKAIFR